MFMTSSAVTFKQQTTRQQALEGGQKKQISRNLLETV
jgi:hypothetical protein